METGWKFQTVCVSVEREAGLPQPSSRVFSYPDSLDVLSPRTEPPPPIHLILYPSIHLPFFLFASVSLALNKKGVSSRFPRLEYRPSVGAARNHSGYLPEAFTIPAASDIRAYPALSIWIHRFSFPLPSPKARKPFLP